MPKYEEQLDLKVIDRIEQTQTEGAVENSPFYYKSKRFKRNDEGNKIYDERGRPVQEEVVEGREKEVVDGVRLLVKDLRDNGFEENTWLGKDDEAKEIWGSWEVNQAERNYLDRQGEFEL